MHRAPTLDQRPHLFVANPLNNVPRLIEHLDFRAPIVRHFTLSFTMVFIDKVAADVGTLRMTFSRRVTVVTTNK